MIENEEKPCKWSDKKGDCWYEMPDSKLTCTNKCEFYEYDGTQVGDRDW